MKSGKRFRLFCKPEAGGKTSEKPTPPCGQAGKPQKNPHHRKRADVKPMKTHTRAGRLKPQKNPTTARQDLKPLRKTIPTTGRRTLNPNLRQSETQNQPARSDENLKTHNPLKNPHHRAGRRENLRKPIPPQADGKTSEKPIPLQRTDAKTSEKPMPPCRQTLNPLKNPHHRAGRLKASDNPLN